MTVPAGPAPAAPWYPWFKAGMLALLACNTAVYAIAGTPSEALDSIAWLLLLASFALETGLGGRFSAGRAAVVLRAVRIAASAAILAAGAGYVRDREWLDALNIGLWIGVVALLELEVRRPATVVRHRARFKAGATLLYAGLAALVSVWLWQGDWFDAYDAALWLIAFMTIELGLLRKLTRGGLPDRPPPAG
jgi:hypothetical protein